MNEIWKIHGYIAYPIVGDLIRSISHGLPYHVESDSYTVTPAVIPQGEIDLYYCDSGGNGDHVRSFYSLQECIAWCNDNPISDELWQEWEDEYRVARALDREDAMYGDR